MSESNEARILSMLINVTAMQEQMLQTQEGVERRLEGIEKRLSSMELKISRIEKCVSFENADFDPSRTSLKAE